MNVRGKSCAFINGNSKITFCGCDRVERYGENEIELRLCDMNVIISGEDLSLSTFVNGEISVTGAIEILQFLKKDGKKHDR